MDAKANGMPLKWYYILLPGLLCAGVSAVGFLFASGTFYHWSRSSPETPAQLVDSWKEYGMWLPDDAEVQFLRSKLPESLVDLRRGIENSNRHVKMCAADAIQALGPDAKSLVPDLKRVLGAEPDQICRIYFAKAFGSLEDGSADTIEFLQTTLANEKDDEVKGYLRYSIQMLTTGQASPTLAELVGHRTTAEKVQTFFCYAILLSLLPLALIFYVRPQIMCEVFAPTTMLPRLALWTILAGMILDSFWYLFVSHAETLGAPPMAWFGNLLFVDLWVYSIYLLFRPSVGGGSKPANNSPSQQAA